MSIIYTRTRVTYLRIYYLRVYYNTVSWYNNATVVQPLTYDYRPNVFDLSTIIRKCIV